MKLVESMHYCIHKFIWLFRLSFWSCV